MEPELGLKVEELEYIGEGVTGPRVRRERAKSGSEASRLIADAGFVSQAYMGNGCTGYGLTLVSCFACLSLWIDRWAGGTGLAGWWAGGWGIGRWRHSLWILPSCSTRCCLCNF